MLMGQLVNAFTSSNFVTDAELETVAELTQQTRDFRYVSITLGTRTLGTPISDEEIASYYEENIGNFTEPESVIAEYVILDKDVIAEEIAVDEADLLAQYETERGEYEGSSEKRAAHILFDIGGSSESETIDLAASVRQRILDGEDFGALALEYSVDTVSAEDEGDIGYTDGTAFPEPIEAALNTLAVGEISEPVVSEFGVHLVKLTEDDTREFQSFEEVAARIERDLKSAQVDQIYAGRLEDLSNLAFETGDLQTISDELNLEIQLSDAIFRSGNSGLFSNPALSSAAFSDEVLLDGNNSDVIELNDSRSVVLRVEQFNEARPLPLEDVEAEIAVILRTEMEREAVQELGEELLIAVESGSGLDELMAENELQWVEANGTDRSAFNVNRELVAHVFAEPAPVDAPAYSSVTLSNDTFVLVELNAVNVGTVADLDDASRSQLVNQMKSDFGGADLSSYIINLRENSDINAPMLEEEQF
jgi:peptidyl-prolyl cis-trans isomerase D